MISTVMASSSLSNQVSIVANELHLLGDIHVTDEPWVPRLTSPAASGRESAFTRDVRARDGKCVISGAPNVMAEAGFWAGFQAAHVFSRECAGLWNQNDYRRWMRGSTVDSARNGLLMFSHLHALYEQYLFSINPDVSEYSNAQVAWL